MFSPRLETGSEFLSWVGDWIAGSSMGRRLNGRFSPGEEVAVLVEIPGAKIEIRNIQYK